MGNKLRREVFISMLAVFIAGSASAADSVTGYIAKMLSGPDSPDSQAQTLFMQYRESPNAAALKQLQTFATNPDAYLAKNILGCIYYNGIGVTKNIAFGTRMFQAASGNNLLAAGNYGLSRIHAGDRTGVGLLKKAFESSGYETQGVQLFIAQAKTNTIDQKLLDRLVVNKEPVGLYYKAQLLYQSQNYTEALRAALDAAEFGSASAPLLVSSCYLALYKIDPNPSSKENANMWFYIDKLISNPSAVAPTYGDELAYRQASFWVQSHRIKRIDYNLAICVNSGRMI